MLHSDWPFLDANLPRGQDLQSVFSSLPSTLTNVPTLQGAHLLLLVAPVLVPYVPAGHFLHSTLHPGLS